MRIVTGFIPPSDRANATTTPAEYEYTSINSTKPATSPVRGAGETQAIPNPRLEEMRRLLQLYGASNEFQNAVAIRVNMMLQMPYGIKKTVGGRAELLDENTEWPLYALKRGNITEPGLKVLEAFWTYEAVLSVAYLALTKSADGSRILVHALNPAYVYRVPGKDGVMDYLYFDQSIQKHVTYHYTQVITLAREGTSNAFKELVLPTSELETSIKIIVRSNQGILSKQESQQQMIGIIHTDDDSQIKSGIKRRKKTQDKFLYLKPEEKYTEVNLVAKDGLEADKMAKGTALEDLYAYIGIPLALREPSDVDPDMLRTAVASTYMHRLVPQAMKFAAGVTHVMCSSVEGVQNREVVVQATKIPQLAAYYVEMTRASVAELNSGKSTINEQREVGGYDPMVLPTEVKDLEWILDTPVPVVKQWAEAEKAKQAAKQSAGRPGEGTGASESMQLPGSNGGRDRRTSGEGKLVDQTGQK